ncbi:1,4-dihydroxy-2-naphthoate octaprenyltransferase [Blattabacterium cuenoti]|uniref:1,4-dihydroxy-2-naphthoate octaprenyltransferase n=1 Tax=Blattabacterium cuenoti TaxID=1653831 RepID=UPI00163BF597|nr:1,4-dihydroxy-2-naphthoate octaprenyltransferase [Blattabacterium cuenoti]
MKLKYWYKSVRIHTLPLSFSGVTLSFLISKSRGDVSFYTYFLCLITALLLQILANFSNNYGDFIKGVDNYYYSNKDPMIQHNTIIQSGFISLLEMRKAVKILSFLSFFSGILLILQSISINIKNIFIFLFFLIGILICIYSSIKYTVGKNPYGYIVGMGDLFVLIFFGLVSVMGSYFLYTHTFCMDILFLSFSVGFLNVSVLNINNMRDIENDCKNGKYTIAGVLGIKYAKQYHIFSVLISLFLGGYFIFLNYKGIFQWFCFVSIFPFFAKHIQKIIWISNPKDLNLELKKLILMTFFHSMSIGIGILY